MMFIRNFGARALAALAVWVVVSGCAKQLEPDDIKKAISGAAASASTIPIDHFVYSNIATPQTAGVPFLVSIAAYDASNNIITAFSGNINFVDLSNTLVPASVHFTNGLASTNFTITQAINSTAIISVPGTNVPMNQSNIFQVLPGPFYKYACATYPTTTQTAGVPFTIVFQAQDAYGNLVATHNTASNIPLTSSLGGLTTPAAPQAFSSGLMTLTNGVTLTKAGNQQVSIFDPTNNKSVSCPSIQVDPGALSAFTLLAPSVQTACTNQIYEIRAFDVYGNLKTNYNSNLTFTVTTSPVTITGTPAFSNGVAFVNANLSLAGADTVTATSIPPGVSVSQGINLSPNIVSQLTIDAIGTPDACTDYPLGIQARDACGNIKTNYNQAFALSVIAGGVAISSGSGSFAAGTANLGSFQVLNPGNSIQLQVVSTSQDGMGVYTGTSNIFNANPNAVRRIVFDTFAGQQTACQTFSATMRLQDGCGNAITAGALASATVNLNEVGGATFSPASAPLVAGVATFSAQVNEVGSGRIIHADAGGGVTGNSAGFSTVVTPTPAKITIANIANQMSCAPFTLTATAQDACNNTVTTFNGAATWSASAGAITPANPGSFSSGVLSLASTKISPVNAGVTVTVNSVAPVLTKVSNAFNVNANTNPYTFNVALSPDYLLQDGSESISVSATSIKDACDDVVPDGTNAVISYAGTTVNLSSAGGNTKTTTSGSTSFSVSGLNTGDIGLKTIRVTIGGTDVDKTVKLQNSMTFSPQAADSYKYSTGVAGTPTLAQIQSGTVYTAGDVAKVTTKDASRLVDIRSPASGWTNLGADMVGGFGSNRISSTGNGLAGFNWAYATNVSRFVAFGGLDFAGAYRSNTYLFNPTSKIWTEANQAEFCSASFFNLITGYGTCTSTAPAGRRNHMMAYSSSIGKVVMFGGTSVGAGVGLNDTWEFDPSAQTWSQMVGAQPTKRHSAVMVTSNNGDLYLFGGVDSNTYYNDLWKYSASTHSWSGVPAGGTKPAARKGAVGGMTSDGRLYIFGGRDAANVYSDTWLFIPASSVWIQVADTNGCGTTCVNSPPSRAYAAGAMVTSRSELIVFGGQASNGLSQNDTWYLTVSAQGSEFWTNGTIGGRPASTSAAGALVFQTGTSNLYMAGGQHGGNANRTDLWTINGASKIWSQLHSSLTTGCDSSQAGSEKCSSPPFPRSAPGFVPLLSTYAAPVKLMSLGGEGSNAKRDDYWSFDPAATSGWSRGGSLAAITGTSGQMRANQMAYLTSTSKALRFGGNWDTGCNSNDTWEYTDSTNTWTQVVGAANCGCSTVCAGSPPQPASQGYGLAYDETADRAVLVGVSAATWEYNPGAQTWTSFGSNIGLRSRVKATSIGSGLVLAYGGSVGGTVNSETWEYNTATHTWTQYFPGANPGARAGYGLAYSPISGKAYLFGGADNSGAEYNDLWEYTPATHTWASLSGVCTNNCTGPVFRSNTEMVFSPQDACLHVFGGESNIAGTIVYLMDRWRYCASGNAVGTYLYHLHGFDVTAGLGVIATADTFELLFTGAAGGDTGTQGVFQVQGQSYVPAGGVFAIVNTQAISDETDISFILPTPVASNIDGSNKVQVFFTPGNPVGQANGAGLMINYSKLRLRYH